MRITGLDAVVLHVSDLAASRRFFGEELGLTAVAGPRGLDTYALGGGPRLVVAPAAAPATTGLTLDLQVEDPEAFAREASARGATPSPAWVEDGHLQVTFRSPDGVMLRARRPAHHDKT